MAAYKWIFVLSLLFIGTQSFHKEGTSSKYDPTDFRFVSRDEWGARPEIQVTELDTPVPYVVMHHTYDPKACNTTEECMTAMRSIQSYHQLIQGWSDIGYNFAVGGDGAVYEGRGWNRVGAHAVGFNMYSIGIVAIGDFVSVVPPDNQLKTIRKLIAKGVELGYIRSDYALIGHRQASATECPGEAFFQEISTWERFQADL